MPETDLSPDLIAAAERQGLDRMLALFPDEVATATRLAREQAAALAVLAVPGEQAS